MINRHSLRIRIIKAFCILGFILSLFYAVFIYFGLDYLEDYLETDFYQQRIQNEFDHFLRQYRRNRDMPLPRSAYLSVYLSPSSMPSALKRLVQGLSDGIYEVKDITAGKEIEYHFIISEIPETHRRIYLFYDTGALEANRQRMPAIILVLSIGLVLVFAISIVIGIATSRRVIAPVIELADLFKKTDPDHLPTDLSKFHYHDELGMLASALEQAMRRIQLFNQREQQFTRNASHELRTPVTVIKGAVELLKQSPEYSKKPVIRRPLLRIERSIADMEDTVDSFLWLARGQAALKTDKKCDVTQLLQETIDQYRYLIEDKSLDVEIKAESDPHLTVPVPLLKIIFGNLIKNAFHYTVKGKISVTVKTDKIIIEDTGIGIESDILTRITEPSVRGPESHGLGVGLAIVKMICDRMGWKITIKSRRNHGTQVVLNFGLTCI